MNRACPDDSRAFASRARRRALQRSAERNRGNVRTRRRAPRRCERHNVCRGEPRVRTFSVVSVGSARGVDRARRGTRLATWRQTGFARAVARGTRPRSTRGGRRLGPGRWYARTHRGSRSGRALWARSGAAMSSPQWRRPGRARQERAGRDAGRRDELCAPRAPPGANVVASRAPSSKVQRVSSLVAVATGTVPRRVGSRRKRGGAMLRQARRADSSPRPQAQCGSRGVPRRSWGARFRHEPPKGKTGAPFDRRVRSTPDRRDHMAAYRSSKGPGMASNRPINERCVRVCASAAVRTRFISLRYRFAVGSDVSTHRESPVAHAVVPSWGWCRRLLRWT